MHYQIIPITEEYIESYSRAVDSVARERKYIAFLEGPPLEKSRKFVLNNIKNDFPHFVALVDGKLIGWCDIAPDDTRPVFKHIGVLGMAIIAGYRGKGIGKALINTALKKAKSIGLTRIELTVREGNLPALALYKKIGFEIEGVKRNAIRIDDKFEDITSMALLFK
jgi:ribosomal protein S18 acetylase RimI-like enzyme